MIRLRLLLAQIGVLAVLFPYVLFGTSHDYLWAVAWFSAIAHFLGGFWAVFSFAWGQNILRMPRNLVICVAAVFGLGIFWEVFEFTIGATHFPADTADTIADMFMDVVGGTAGALIMRYVWVQR